MRKLLLLLSTVSLSLTAQAQTADFDSLHLSGTDTFYVNYAHPLADVGFDNGFLHFPYIYDTAFGGLWTAGFAYSNKKDSVTSGSNNMYAAKTAKGYNGSDKYAVYWAGYDIPKAISLAHAASWFVPEGLYFTNSTYAYNSMRDGDAYAKKFGGATGNDSDWFKVTVRGYQNGALKRDSVVFYLADFRSPDRVQDYIVKDWRYVSLLSLGAVDSMCFMPSSSDTGTYGMNTPAYFCLDNLSIHIPINGVGAAAAAIARVYPNPTTNLLHVMLNDAAITVATIYDITGKSVARQLVNSTDLTFNTSAFTAGVYTLKLEGTNGTASMRFVKQ